MASIETAHIFVGGEWVQEVKPLWFPDATRKVE